MYTLFLLSVLSRMNLQHVVRYRELHHTYEMDAFFKTEAALPGFTRSLPATVDVITGCIVPVSYILGPRHILDALKF